MKRHPQDAEILAGGKGREASEVQAAATALMFCGLILLAAICVIVLGGCVRPTARVSPSVDATAEERAASDTPDRPRWEDLRQQMGGL